MNTSTAASTGRLMPSQAQAAQVAAPEAQTNEPGDTRAGSDQIDTHVVVTGVKSRSHLVYIASYVRTLLDTGRSVKVSMIEAPAFLSANAVGVDDARAMLPVSPRLDVESGLPGWRFTDGVQAVYVAVGAPGLKASLALRRANPRRRITCVVTDEGIGTYGSFTSRRDAIMRQGVPRVKASARAALVVGSSRLLTSQRWAAYEREGNEWHANPAVVEEFRRDVVGTGTAAGGSPGSSDLAVILTQPFVDLGLCDEAVYLAYVDRLVAAARDAGLRPVVRAHPAERRGRYAAFDVMRVVGTADLDPEVIGAALVLGGPSTALVNLAAMFDAPTIWVSEPTLAHLDTEVSSDQAAIFATFLGAPVPLSEIENAVRSARTP